jgi:hypothetical protein
MTFLRALIARGLVGNGLKGRDFLLFMDYVTKMEMVKITIGTRFFNNLFGIIFIT